MRDRLLRRKRLSRAQVLAGLSVVAIFGSALAVDLPAKKPGLWVSSKLIHFNMAGKPPDTDNTPRADAMCTDASTDAIEAKLMAGGSGQCGLNIEGSGNTYTISGACPDPMGGGQMVTHGKIVRKSDTEIHMESQSTSPHMSSSVVAEAKWVGACPAGVMPGDQGTFVNGVFKKSRNIKDAFPTAR
jgi:hypothetical protein